jgi:hypothetical protein
MKRGRFNHIPQNILIVQSIIAVASTHRRNKRAGGRGEGGGMEGEGGGDMVCELILLGSPEKGHWKKAYVGLQEAGLCRATRSRFM